MLEEGVGNQADRLPPTLLVMNKKDLIKPGEIAKKLEVSICLFINYIYVGIYNCTFNSGSCCFSYF